jgi:SAM-dependent methyltransferase
MPSLESNRAWWDGAESDNHWFAAGDNWSDAYGTPEMQWYGSVLPRIHRFVPTATLLEIAPGFGRWTQYLARIADRLIAVDISERCIEVCRARFRHLTNIEYHVNDGRSLGMVEDGSVDFAFSFDSLVHVELDVLEAYLKQLRAKLKPNGVAFIHHSNIGEFAGYFALLDKLPRGRGLLSRLKLVEASDQKRAKSVTAEAFRRTAESTGLAMVSQEIINWRSQRPIDCISVVAQRGSRWAGAPMRRTVNTAFDAEAAYLNRLSRLYASKTGDVAPGSDKPV